MHDDTCPLCKSSQIELNGRCKVCRFPVNPVLVPVMTKAGISYRLISEVEFGLYSREK
jgi:hypothetical protein